KFAVEPAPGSRTACLGVHNRGEIIASSRDQVGGPVQDVGARLRAGGRPSRKGRRRGAGGIGGSLGTGGSGPGDADIGDRVAALEHRPVQCVNAHTAYDELRVVHGTSHSTRGPARRTRAVTPANQIGQPQRMSINGNILSFYGILAL